MAARSLDDPQAGGHTAADHLYGDALAHEHGPDADHDHDDFGPQGRLEDNPIWLEDNVFLRSVGIDIGSSGTQVVFSQLHLRRIGEDLTSRYVVIRRDTLFQSPVELTPYSDAETIDDRRLGELIDEAYGAAGIDPASIDTGAVILTGEALRRRNAQRIADILAARGGQFVCATAGHHMEALLAAYGSGAVRRSFDESSRILNVDIGGGTTKLALIERGRILGTAALHIGGRLVVVGDGLIERLDPAGRHHGSEAGFDWHVGAPASGETLDRVADRMAGILVCALQGGTLPDEAARLLLTDPLPVLGHLDGLVFSGGVGEYVYGRETRDFGDLGRRLGFAIARRLAAGDTPWPLLPAGECIRATALGASQYSVQLSGNTSFISDPGALLPRRNLAVVRPDVELEERIDAGALAGRIANHLRRFEIDGETDVALALSWRGSPDYRRLRAFAEGIAGALASRIAAGRPVMVMLDGDVAMTLGSILSGEMALPVDVLVLDGLALHDFDFIDLGRLRLPSRTVPVTIKSLVFSETARPGRSEVQRLHHHDGHAHRGHSHHGHSHPHGGHGDHHHRHAHS